MNLQEKVDRGQKAAALLSNTIYQEGWDSVAQAIHEKWEACPLRDRDGAHELKLMLKLLRDVRIVFEAAVDDGKMAAAELDRLNRNVISPAQWSGR